MYRRLNKESAFICIFVFFSLILLLIPTGFQKDIYFNAEGARAKVISTDDSTIMDTGLFRQGEQRVELQLLSGKNKGRIIEGVNMLSGSLAQDKVFVAGDIAWVLVEMDKKDEPVFVNAVDNYRISREIVLVALFFLSLVLFAGKRGIRMIFSFVFSFLCIWKLLIPSVLKGYEPIAVCSIMTMLICASTLFLVSGVNRRGLAAFLGALCSIAVTIIIAAASTSFLMIHGSVLEMSESLLYSGFMDLDLTALFSGIVTLAAGGAITDLSIDVSAAVWEVGENAENASFRTLFSSGMEIGRAGVGTQTTTLLLAYMGSYLTVMMVYMAQSTPVFNILTSKQIASELVQALTGAFGIISVTPITAFFAAKLFRKASSYKKILQSR